MILLSVHCYKDIIDIHVTTNDFLIWVAEISTSVLYLLSKRSYLLNYPLSPNCAAFKVKSLPL